MGSPLFLQSVTEFGVLGVKVAEMALKIFHVAFSTINNLRVIAMPPKENTPHSHPKLEHGSVARLFPMLADTNRENRIASIFLAILPLLPDLANQLLSTVGHRLGKRSTIDVYTEVVFKSEPSVIKSNEANGRPDGFLVVHNGKKNWEALIEAKISTGVVKVDQVERYLELAKAKEVDAVITISNEFVASPEHSPVNVRKTLIRKVGLYHWSWTFIRTQCEMLRDQGEVESPEQRYLLDQFIQLLEDKGTGIKRFNEMPEKWPELIKMVAAKQPIPKSSDVASEVVAGWFCELRDASLLLSREIAQPVKVKVERSHRLDPDKRLKDGVAELCESQLLRGVFQVPDAAGDIKILADLSAKDIVVLMKIKAPQDKKRTSSRVNWLLRMLKEDDDRLHVQAHWPGRKLSTQKPVSILRELPDAIDEQVSGMVPHTFDIVMRVSLGQRFGKKVFVEEMENLLTDFYWKAGQYVKAWQAPPPKPVKRREDEVLEESGE